MAPSPHSTNMESVDDLLVPTITLTEVFKNICRQRDEDAALLAITHMEQGTVIPLDSKLAIDAACLGIDNRLPLADSIIYATAKQFDALLWTQDADFQGLRNVQFYAKSSTS